MDITQYFLKDSNEKLDGRPLDVSIPGCSSGTTISAARELKKLQEENDVKKKRQTFPENIKKEVARYAWKNGIPAARKWAASKYPNHVFKRESVRDWKTKFAKHFETLNENSNFSLPRVGRPAMIKDEYTTEIKSIIHNLRASGGAISRKTVIAIGN